MIIDHDSDDDDDDDTETKSILPAGKCKKQDERGMCAIQCWDLLVIMMMIIIIIMIKTMIILINNIAHHYDDFRSFVPPLHLAWASTSQMFVLLCIIQCRNQSKDTSKNLDAQGGMEEKQSAFCIMSTQTCTKFEGLILSLQVTSPVIQSSFLRFSTISFLIFRGLLEFCY